MSAFKVKLIRNLRKSVLQGNPWIYKQAIQAPADVKTPGLCKVADQKGEFLCWGLYSPNSVLAVRVLSLLKKPPTVADFEGRLSRAYNLRKKIISPDTNCFRLFNGEGDYLPGLICDLYNSVAVLQFDGPDPLEFWDQEWLSAWLLENTSVDTVYFKPRHDMNAQAKTWGEPLGEDLLVISENGNQFYVDVVNGQKTGFFLDQRDNRQHIKAIAKNKSVINLFSYSGGFSIYAGQGGASSVTSVDIADGALKLAEKNWLLNKLPEESHHSECADVFEFIRSHNKKYDIVICDPPSLAKSERHKEQAVQKYIDTFSSAAKMVTENGDLILSSCSSHISFTDFNDIIISALSKSRKTAQILKISGQGADHPFPHACEHLRYLKFVHLVMK